MRILIVKMSSLGDLFHALPTVRALRRGLNADVDWVVHSAYVDLVRCFDDVSRVLAFPRRSFVAGFPAFRRALREVRYDLIVDLQGLLKSAAVCRLARGARRIGPSFAREGSSLLVGERAPAAGRPDRHAVERCLDTARYLGVGTDRIEFPVTFPGAGPEVERPCVAMLPVSRWPTKNWPAERFAETGRLLLAGGVRTLLLMGGAGDVATCERIRRELDGRALVMAGRTSLPEMGAILRDADALLANDSGPVHMAAAVGTPCVVVFGPTDSARTGPYGPGHRTLAAGLPCAPCFSRRCRRGDVACLAAVTAAQARDAVLDALARPRTGARDR